MFKNIYKKRFVPIAPLLTDDSISDIFIIAYNVIHYFKNGRLRTWDQHWESDHALEAAISFLNNNAPGDMRTFGERHPTLDITLPNGDRVSATHKSISGTTEATIRRFRENVFQFDDYIDQKLLTEDEVQKLKKYLDDDRSIIIAGGPESGKTTFMRTLLNYKLQKMNGILQLVEDPREISLNHPQCRHHAIVGDYTMEKAIRHALRNNPTCFVLGELREPEAAYSLLMGLLSGLPSLLATLHAPDADSVVKRLVYMLARLRLFADSRDYDKFVRSTIDVVIHIKHDRLSRKRQITIKELSES